MLEFSSVSLWLCFDFLWLWGVSGGSIPSCAQHAAPALSKGYISSPGDAAPSWLKLNARHALGLCPEIYQHRECSIFEVLSKYKYGDWYEKGGPEAATSTVAFMRCCAGVYA